MVDFSESRGVVLASESQCSLLVASSEVKGSARVNPRHKGASEQTGWEPGPNKDREGTTEEASTKGLLPSTANFTPECRSILDLNFCPLHGQLHGGYPRNAYR